jgi:CTD small phosphatase-like protein 2
LDLDETLVHFQELEDFGQFFVRPFAPQFLQEMGKYYEIVIFTAAVQEVIDFCST